MINIQFDNLKLKVKFWSKVKHKNIDFISGYLHSNFDIINQSEYNKLIKYAKTFIK